NLVVAVGGDRRALLPALHRRDRETERLGHGPDAAEGLDDGQGRRVRCRSARLLVLRSALVGPGAVITALSVGCRHRAVRVSSLPHCPACGRRSYVPLYAAEPYGAAQKSCPRGDQPRCAATSSIAASRAGWSGRAATATPPQCVPPSAAATASLR